MRIHTHRLSLSNAKLKASATRRWRAGLMQSAVVGALEELETRRLFAALVWNPQASSTVWDVNTTANWLDTASNTQVTFHNGDVVSFGDTGAGTVNIAAGGVSPTNTTFNSSQNYTLDGSLNGPGASGLLSLNGSGAVTLTGSTANSGFHTTVSAGTLVLAKSPGIDALPFVPTGGLATINVVGGILRWASSDQINNADGLELGDNTAHPGTADLNNQNETLGVVASSGDANVLSTGTGNLSVTGLAIGNATTTIAAGGSISVSNTMTQSGGVTTVGGTLSLGTGQSTLFNGSVNVLGTGLFTTDGGQLVDNRPITVQPGGVMNVGTGGLQLGPTSITLQSDAGTPGQLNLGGTLTVPGSGDINSGGSAALPGRVNLATTQNISVGGTLRVFAQIAGAGGFNETGGGFVLLSGNNTYTGLTTFNGNFLELGNANALGSTAAGTVMGNNTHLDLNGQTVNENVTFTANGVLRNESNNSVINGGGTNHLPGILNGTLGIGGTVQLAGNNNSTLAGVISGAGGFDLVTNVTFLINNNANSYSGGTKIDTGVLQTNVNNGLGTGAITMTAGTLQLVSSTPLTLANAVNATAGSPVIRVDDSTPGSGGATGTVTHTITGAVTLSSGATLNVNQFNSYSLALTGKISGAGAISDSDTTVILSNSTNDYSGGTTLTGVATPIVRATASNATGTGTITMTRGQLQLVSTAPITLASGLNITADSPSVLVDDDTLGAAGSNAEVTHIINGAVNISPQTSLTVNANNQYNLRFNGAMTNDGTLIWGDRARVDIAGAYSSPGATVGTIAAATNVGGDVGGTTTSDTTTNLTNEDVHILNNVATSIERINTSIVIENGTGAPVTLTSRWGGDTTGGRSSLVLRNGARFVVGAGAVIDNSTANGTTTLPWRAYGDINGGGTLEFDPGFLADQDGSTSSVNDFQGERLGGPLTVITNDSQNLPTIAFAMENGAGTVWSVRTSPQVFDPLAHGPAVNFPNAGVIVGSDATIETLQNLTLMPITNANGPLRVSAGVTLTVSNGGGSGRLILGGTQNSTIPGSLAVLGIFDHVANNLTVNQTLSGNGTILGSGTTTVTGAASNISPGTSNGADIGTLNTTNLLLAPSAKYNATLSATGDQINVTGTVNITGSTLVIDPSSTGAAASYTIINNDGTDLVGGTFNGRPEGSTIVINGKTFKITYHGGTDGNDVVLNSNIPPVANDDNVSGAEDTNISGTVLANDTDADNNILTATKLTDPTNGTVSFNSDGSFTYTPNANFNGSDSFTYKANDGQADSNVATVHITVTPVNDNPDAIDDSATVNEGQSVNIAVLGNDTDIDNDTLSVVSVTQGANGSVVINGDGTVTYAHNGSETTSDSFTYTVSDGHGGTDSASVNITVTPVNDAPVAANGSVSGNEDTPISGNLSASDPDSTSLTYSVVSGPSNGTLTSFNPATGAFTYQGNLNSNGADSFSFRASDGSLSSNVATESITVNAVNDAPVASDGSASGNEDTPISGNLSASDVDNASLTYSIVAGPSNGTLTSFNPATGAFTYQGNQDYLGPDSFTFRASDGSLSSNVATESITVNPVNDAPFANNDSVNGNEDSPIPGNLSAEDPDSTSLTYSIVSGPSNGTITSFDASTGAFNYQGNLNYSGPDSFTFQASDGSASSNVATESITVDPVNDAPVASDGSTSGNEDTPIAGNLSASDVDSASITYAIISGPSNGMITNFNAATGAFTYKGNQDYFGPDSFTFQASDGSATSNVSTENITVNAVNDAPVASNGSASGNEDTNINGSVFAGDVDGPSTTYSIVSGPAHGSITSFDPSTGAFTYLGNQDFNGGDSFTFKASDGSLNSNVATEGITVNPVNDAPTAQDDNDTVNEDSSKTSNVVANDSAGPGDENQSLTVTAVTQGAHGSVTNNNDGTITYTPNANYNGTDSYTYTVKDSDGAAASATVFITINPVNDKPTVAADHASVTVNETQTATNTGTFNDIDGDNVTLTASEGTITKSGTSGGTWSWSKATTDDEATHTVTITANDGHGGIGTTTFTLTVNNVAPTATNDTYSTPQGTPKSGNVITDNTGSGADSDPAGANDPLTVSAYTQPMHGAVVVAANGSFTYTPATAFAGVDTFTYTISDGDGGSSTATVTINVTAAGSGSIVTIPDNCMGGTALLVTGTSAADDIHVSPGSDSSTLKITVNGVTTIQPRPSGRVIVIAGDGDDNVQVDGAISNSVWLYGDAGNDRLNAGNVATHGNLLIGGDGNDDLSGGNGRDVMIGGQGADKIVGNAEDDILVAGYTTKDKRTDVGHDEFWCDILDEWSSANTFQNRVHNIKNDGLSTQPGHNGVSYLNSTTLRDDTSIDQIDMLNGSSGSDWYIFQFGEDKIVGESSIEQQYDTTTLP